MKKKIIILGICVILLITTLMIGCNKKDTNTFVQNQNIEQSKSTAIKFEEEQKVIMDNFDKLVKGNVTAKDVFDFVDNNIKYVSKDNASKLVLGIETIQNEEYDNSRKNFLNKQIPQQGENFASDTTQEKMEKEFGTGRSYDINSKIDKVNDKQLKDFLVGFKDSGYKIICEEGMYFAVIDYDFYKKYNQYITSDIKEYIDINSLESSKPLSYDGFLDLPHDEIYSRAVRLETFLNDYPNSFVFKEIEFMYQHYVTSYFNTYFAFDQVTNKLTDEANDSYVRAVSSNINSKLVEAVKRYLTILQKNGYKLTNEVQKYVESISI